MVIKSYLKSNQTGYGTDLTDKPWQVIKNLLDDKERKHKHFLHKGVFLVIIICATMVAQLCHGYVTSMPLRWHSCANLMS